MGSSLLWGRKEQPTQPSGSSWKGVGWPFLWSDPKAVKRMTNFEMRCARPCAQVSKSCPRHLLWLIFTVPQMLKKVRSHSLKTQVLPSSSPGRSDGFPSLPLHAPPHCPPDVTWALGHPRALGPWPPLVLLPRMLFLLIPPTLLAHCVSSSVSPSNLAFLATPI